MIHLTLPSALSYTQANTITDIGLVVVIVLLIGLLAWFVWDHIHNRSGML